ncbi:hypothetical protein ScPMuIL_013793 [Solemya velum]
MNFFLLLIFSLIMAYGMAASPYIEGRKALEKCRDDLRRCRKKCPKITKKPVQWICQAACWVDFQDCISPIQSKVKRRHM